MFEAFIIVCAASLSQEIYPSTCTELSDVYGPYLTQEQCLVRTVEMVNDVTSGKLAPIFFELYMRAGVPIGMLYAEGHCEQNLGESV
jgi:hypothetical protein